MVRRYRRRAKPTPEKLHARIIAPDDTARKRKIKQQIAKKKYEIELLQIDIDHPKKPIVKNQQKIGFSLHPEKDVN